jgi:pimeloyl-[acyl-carrier protein] synthase
MRKSMGSTPEIDLGSREFVRNPYPTYRQLRAHDGPYWLPHEGRAGTPGLWLFSRYDDVAAVLRNTRSISKDVGRLVPADQLTAFDRILMNLDPPDHTRLRALVAPHFAVRRVGELEPAIEAIVERLLAEMAGGNEAEFMADFAIQLPILLLAAIVGVPLQDMPALKGWTDDLITGFDSARSGSGEKAKLGASLGALTAYLAGLMRRSGHADDTLIGDLTRQQRERGEPSSEELLSMCVLMVLAGYETTVNLLGNGLLTLLSHPEQLAVLRQDPGLLPGAIDELLRFESPVQRTSFRVTSAACTIGGFSLEEGQQVSAVIGAANRDPEQFPAPDVFDIRRSPNRHLAFGAGIHKCLGERLARAEARIAFGRLLQRFPAIELLDSEPDWKDQTLLRGLRTLRVRLRN